MINFTNVGFVNFNKDYNKVLKSGAITASMSTRIRTQLTAATGTVIKHCGAALEM